MHESPIQSTILGTGGSVTWGKSPDGRDCLICVPSTVTSSNLALIKQDLTANIPFGKSLTLRCKIRAAALTAPAIPQASYTLSSALLGGAQGPSSILDLETGNTGTYDWKEVNLLTYMNSDSTNFVLRLGCSGGVGATGTLYISDVQFVAGDVSDVTRPEPDLSFVPSTPPLFGFQVGANPSRDDYFKIQSNYKGNIIRVGIYQGGGDYPQATNAEMKVAANYKAWFDGKLIELRALKKWARQNGQIVVLNLGRMMRSDLPFEQYVSGAYCIMSAAQHEMFLYAWRQIAQEFIGEDWVWFDIMNEPGTFNHAVPGGADHVSWHTATCNAIREIRAIDPNRTIVAEFYGIGHPLWCKWGAKFPFDNIVYSAHVYAPGSSYNLSMSAVNTYPGFQLKNQAQVMHEGYVQYNDPGLVVDKEYLRNQFQALRDFQLRYKVPIYIGEFGLQRWCLGADIWYQHCIELFKEYGWSATVFEFNNGDFHPEFSATPVAVGQGTYVGPTTARALALKAGMANNVNPFTNEVVTAPVVTARDTSPSSVTLTWVFGDHTVGSISAGYRVSGGAWTDSAVARDRFSTTITGLTPGLVYEFRVTVASDYGSAAGVASLTKDATVRAYDVLSAAGKAAILGGWGARIVNPAYSGPILSVRNDAGVVLDIGADAGGEYLDEAAILTHCGAGGGLVTKEWDTTGKGKHIDQTNTTRMAKIVVGGAINKLHGKAAVKFEGGQGYGGAGLGLYAAGSMTIMGIGQQDSGNVGNTTICGEFHSSLGQMYWILPGQTPGPVGEAKMYLRNDAGTVFLANLASAARANGFPVGSVGQFLVQDRSHQRIWIGSKDLAEPIVDVALANGTVGAVTLNRFCIGARFRSDGDFSSGIRAQFHEIIAFGAVLSPEDEQALRANQIEFYGMPT
jgi:hypothetical protein